MNRFNHVITLLAYSILCNLYAQSDQLGSLLADLIYDSSKSYSAGNAVLISLEDGDIYTSTKEVPAATDDSNAPNGINGSTYWKNSEETVTSFESTNSDYLNSLAFDIDTNLLSQEVAALVTPTSDQSTSFINSENDGYSVVLLNEFMAKRNYKYTSNHNMESNYTTDWNSYDAEFYNSNIFGENLLFSNAKEELISINEIDYLCKTFLFQQSHQWGDFILTSPNSTSYSATFYRSVSVHSSLGVLKWNVTDLSSSAHNLYSGGADPQPPQYIDSETNNTFIISSFGEHAEAFIDSTDDSIDEGNKSNWNKLFNEWIQDPVPYGGMETLEEIKKAKDQNSTTLSIYKHMTDLTPLAGLEDLRSLWFSYYDENLEGIESVDYSPLSNLTKLESLSLYYQPFSDLSSLSELTSLTSLSFGFTDLSDLSALSNFPKLEHLLLQTNQLSDISTLPSLPSLRSITLSENVDDINPLSQLSNLEVLTIYDINQSDEIQVSDITPLLELTNLTDLYIQNDDLNASQREMLFSGLAYTQIVLDGIFLERNRNVWNVQYDKWIKDPALYGGLESIEEIKKAYESNQTVLNLENRNITDISPLSFLKNLQNLNLSDNNITDLSPFLQLSDLKVLNLGNNQISDLQPLGNLHELEVLQLEDNFILDVSPLTELKKIKNLNLGDNYISNISPLEELTALEILNLDDNYIFSDLYYLLELAGVKEIEAEEGQVILNLSEYADPTYFKDLDLENNFSFSDSSSLVKLGNLQELNLNDNYITDLSSLSMLGKLTNLTLNDNFINDLLPLTKLENLEGLELRDNNITDLEPLSILTNLKSLNVEENPTKDSGELALLEILSETQISSRLSNKSKTGEEIITNKFTSIGPISFEMPERYSYTTQNYSSADITKLTNGWDSSWAQYAPLAIQSIYLTSNDHLDQLDITLFDFSKIEDSFLPELSEIASKKPHVYLAVILRAHEIFLSGMDVSTAIANGQTSLGPDWQKELTDNYPVSNVTPILTKSDKPGSLFGFENDIWSVFKLSEDSSVVALAIPGENHLLDIEIAKSLSYDDTIAFENTELILLENDSVSLSRRRLSEIFKRTKHGETNWYDSDWLGTFFETKNQWTYHTDMSWAYAIPNSSSPESVWLWKEGLGWLWSSENSYPYLYSDTSKFWIYLNSEDIEQSKYYDYFDEQWRDWENFPTRTIAEIEGRSIERMLQSDKSSEKIADEIMSIIMRGL